MKENKSKEIGWLYQGIIDSTATETANSFSYVKRMAKEFKELFNPTLNETAASVR